MVRPILKEANISLAKRESLPAKKFAIPATKAKRLGVSGEIQGESKGKYPIDTPRRARNALARVSQFGTPGERAAVRSKVYAKFPGLREGFKERHGGESPTAKKNIRKVEQGGVGKTASAVQFAAFVDEMVKIGGFWGKARQLINRPFAAGELRRAKGYGAEEFAKTFEKIKGQVGPEYAEKLRKGTSKTPWFHGTKWGSGRGRAETEKILAQRRAAQGATP